MPETQILKIQKTAQIPIKSMINGFQMQITRYETSKLKMLS